MTETAPTPLSVSIAENVRLYRKSQRVSQADVAEQMRRLGHSWTHSTASNVERGERPLSVHELFALALTLGVNPRDLLNPSTPVAFGQLLPLVPWMFERWMDREITLRLDPWAKPEMMLVVPVTGAEQAAAALRRTAPGGASFPTEKESGGEPENDEGDE